MVAEELKPTLLEVQNRLTECLVSPGVVAVHRCTTRDSGRAGKISYFKRCPRVQLQDGKIRFSNTYDVGFETFGNERPDVTLS